LVINALKHAFPGGRGGRIVVGYAGEAEGWALTVSDDGIGMSLEAAGAKAGLGSGIVTALVAQLGAAIVVSDANPGTRVSICHEANGSADVRAVLAPV
jgi:two-component sensor histidine kinase